MSTKAIPQMVVKAGNGAKKFLEKLEEVSLAATYGKKTFNSEDLAAYDPSDPKQRKNILRRVEFFRDPSVESLTTLLKTLNGYELCNPFSFALSQAQNAIDKNFEEKNPGEPTPSEKFNQFQGKVRDIFERFRNFSLFPGVAEVTGATVNGNPVAIERRQKFDITFPSQDQPYPVTQDTTFIFRSTNPSIAASMSGKVIAINGNTFTVDISSATTIEPPIDPETKQPALFSTFDVEFGKQLSTDVIALSEELSTVADALKELGYQDILNDLNGIPDNFPGVGKIKATFTKIGAFIDKIGTVGSQIGDEAEGASQFLAGGLTSREVLEGSRLFQDFFRKIEPIVNFQNSIITGYKNTVEDLNNILRNAIPFEELSKFIKFVTDFARIIQGVVSMLIVLLKTINFIVKTVTTILKVFKVVIKVIKVAIVALPSLFTTVGIIQQISDKLDQAEEALGTAIIFLENISKFLERITRSLQVLKNALGVLIEEGTKLAAKLGSCAAMKGNGMENGMEYMVNQLRNSLRNLTGASPGEDYYPDDPNAPGRGLIASQLPDGVNSFVRLPNGEIMFVNDSIIGFDENGNLIFFGDLTSLSTGVSFNDTLGQSFRNRNLKFYTFDKFRNSQASMLDAADRLANERNNRVQEIDPTDRFGNFAEVYRGYTIKIQEEEEENPNAQKATRRRGIALDSNERLVVSTSLTFSDNLSGIVNEVKFLLDRDISEGILGVNTSDSQANEPSDSDAINLAKTIGANPIAVNNIEAENNNKTASTVKPIPPTENPTRIGNRPFTKDDNKPSQQREDGQSPRKAINTGGIASKGIQQFIKDTPSLSGLANNLNTINKATPSQLSNILREPGIENLTEEELVEKLKGEILSSIDPNPEKIDEVKEKTRQWYEGIRSKARADFDRIKLSASIPKGGGRVFSNAESYEFEPFVSKIEEQEIPKWIKLLQRSGYTENEINAGLQGEGIKDKYDIKITDSGKIEVRKKTAFKEGNF